MSLLTRSLTRPRSLLVVGRRTFAVNSDGDTTLYRPEFVDKIAKDHEIYKSSADRILTTVFDIIVEVSDLLLETSQYIIWFVLTVLDVSHAQAVTEKRTVKLANFGKFECVHSKERKGRSIQTGEEIVIPERDRVRFTPFTAFKKSVNKKK